MAKTKPSQAKARDTWIQGNLDYNYYIKKRSGARLFSKKPAGTRLAGIVDAPNCDSRIDYIQDLSDTMELYREAIEREKHGKEVQRLVLTFESPEDKQLLADLSKAAKKEKVSLSEYVKKVLKSNK